MNPRHLDYNSIQSDEVAPYKIQDSRYKKLDYDTQVLHKNSVHKNVHENKVHKNKVQNWASSIIGGHPTHYHQPS